MRKILLSLLSVFISLSIMAGNVTEQEALSIAQKFMQGKTLKQKSLRRAHAIGDNQFYVFNAEGQGGFVIVSADDRTVPILGYADQGSLETDHLPANARFWLESYAAQIKTLANDVQTSSTPRRALGAPVAPLLTCQWDQGEPYNHMCTFYAGYCVTGCVATAMAQVMYYHKWPQAPTTTIPAYMTQHNLSVPELSPTVFKWDKMKDTYTSNETGEAADAVAELMRYCGQAVEMDYRPNESAASVYATVMTHYFGYSQTARNVTRSTYTSLEWERLIYQEMASKRPVLYSGQSTDVGHQFVIDGYDERGLFHVNWGWGGQSDGYFTLSILNPDSRGTGGGASSNGYTMDQDAIIGLQPDQGQQAVTTLYCQSPETNERTFTRSSSANDFQIGISGRIFSAGLWNVSFDHQWVLYKDGEQVKSLETKRDLTIQSNRGYNYYDGITVPSSLSFGAGLADGIYELRQMTCTPGTDQWELCQYLDNNFLLAEISGNTLALKYANEIEGAVQVNNVSLSGKMKTRRPITLHMNWTNKGYQHETPFYVKLSGLTAGAASSFVERGETGDVDIAFTSKYGGTYNMTVLKDKNGSDVVYEQEITIDESLPQNLSATFAIEGEVDNAIEGTTINATVTFTNNGTNDYNDDVIFYLYTIDEDYNINSNPLEVVKPLNVPAGSQASINLQFPDLTAGTQYYLETTFYSPDVEFAGGITCYVGAVRQNLSAYIEIEGMTKDYIEGTTINATAYFTNNGPNQYDDNVVFVLYQIDENYNYVGDPIEIKKPLKLAAGSQGTVTAQFPDLTAGQSYYLFLQYYKPSRTAVAYTYCTVGKVVVPVTLEVQTAFANSNGTLKGNAAIEGTTAKLNITLKNTSAYDFDDKVTFYVYRITDNANPQYVKEQHFTAQVPAGQTKVVENYEITDLEISDLRYLAQIYYGDNYAGFTPYFYMVKPSGNDPDPNPGTQKSPAEDVTLMVTGMNTKELGSQEIEGTTAKVDFRLQNNGSAPHNFRLDVVTYRVDFEPTYTLTEAKTDYISVELAAGEAKIINHEITGLQTGKNYRCYLYFFTPEYGQQQINNINLQFKMVTPTGIQDITADQPSDEPAYNLAGQRISGKAKGIVIKRGKKFAVK